MRTVKFVAAGALIGLAGLLSAFAVAAQDAPGAGPADTISLPIPTTLVSTTVPSIPVTTTIPSVPLPTTLVSTTVPSLPTTTVPSLPTTTLLTTTTKSNPTQTTGSSAAGTTTAGSAGGSNGGSNGGNNGGSRTTPGVLQPRCRTRSGLPDRRCTPGAANRRLAARQACSAKRARSAPLSAAMKRRIFADYGVASGSQSRYRIDRLISVQLGGSNAAANLWPQATSGRLNANNKDRAEAYLLRRVCSGKLSLGAAQRKLARNWVAVYLAIRPR